MDNEDILVSVVCLTYNHGKYIRRAIESFLEQKTDFKYEIFIHDDASTDNTRAIIESYRKKHPGLIKAIYQDENQYSKHVPIKKKYIYPHVRGKYIAFCEGDDYWCDSTKLQKQVNVFQTNPHLIMVCHNTTRVTEDGNNIDIVVKGKSSGICIPSDFINKSNGLCPHYSSFMIKSEIEMLQKPSFFSLVTGDNATRLFCLAKGDVYYLNHTMSVYRTGVPGSWTSKFRADRSIRLAVAKNKVEFWNQYNQYTDRKYAKEVDKEIIACKVRINIYLGNYKEAYLYSKKIDLKWKLRIKIFILAKIPFMDNIANCYRRKRLM